jgi:hypothetical protein
VEVVLVPQPEIPDDAETEPLTQRVEEEDRAVSDAVRRAVKQYLATTAV